MCRWEEAFFLETIYQGVYIILSTIYAHNTTHVLVVVHFNVDYLPGGLGS